MADNHILLACPECNKGVAVYYQGPFNADEYYKCSCGNDMVDTQRDAEGRIVVPQRVKDGSVTRERMKANAAP